MNGSKFFHKLSFYDFEEKKMYKASHIKLLIFNFFYRVTLMLNDVSVLSIGGSNDTTASNSILLPLNARDRVWIELSQGKLVEPYQFTDSQYNGPKKSGYTSFIGYLIGEISQDVISDTIDFEYDDNHNQGKFGFYRSQSQIYCEIFSNDKNLLFICRSQF